MLILSFAEDFWSVVYYLLIGIGSLIYSIISNVYQVFMAISSARIFTSEQYQSVANNIYIVIGIAALFFIAYGLLQAIINPDSAGGKNEKSVAGIIKNVLLSIVLIAFTPTIFNFAFALQDVIIGGNVIQNLIFHNNSNAEESDLNISSVGATLANETFITSFYPIDSEGNPLCTSTDVDLNGTAGNSGFVDCLNEIESDDGNGLGDVYKDVSESGDFDKYKQFSSNVYNKSIKVNFILLYFVGIFMCYIFISFCFDMGLRAVKLAYYEIIAPLPILTLIIPGQKKVFDNWKKSSLSTFTEVFIRLVIVFFVLFLIKNLPSLDDTIWSDSLINNPSTGVKLFAKIFIILGLLLFMKQAPKLLGDMFGIQSGSFKLGIRDKFKEATDFSKVPVIGRAQGAVTGAAGSAWTAMMNRGKVGKAALWGAYQGGKGKGSQFNKQRENLWTDVYGMKGPAGVFGGRSWINRKTGEWKNKMNDDFLQYDNAKGLGTNSRILRKMESTKPFTDIRDNYKKSATDLINELAQAEHPFNLKIKFEQNKIDGINSQLHNKQLQLNGLDGTINNRMDDMTNDYISYLKLSRDSAVRSGNAAEVASLNQQITDAENGKASKEVLDYAKTNNTVKYNAYQNAVNNRNIVNTEVNNLKTNLQTSQATLDNAIATKNADANVVAAQKSLTDLGIKKDELGNNIEIKTASDLTTKDIEDYAFGRAKKDFRKANYEYSWRIEAEEKEKREVDIKRAKTTPENQAMKDIFEEAFKKYSGSNDKKS